MRNSFSAVFPLFFGLLLFLSSCEDEVGTIGGSIVEGEVNISADSTFKVSGRSVYTPDFDARSGTLLLGKLSCPEYGDLESSFVTQLMPAVSMSLSEDIDVNAVDSMVLKLNYRRNAVTGDSLAPQQVKVFALTKKLPSGILNTFDPSGYYDRESPLGMKNFTASALGMNDTVFLQHPYGHINVKMPLSLARDFFTAYRTRPEIFSWPSAFADYFPGIYVENSFGNGCIVNITVAEMSTYYHYNKKTIVIENGVGVEKDVVAKDSVTLFSTAPEVLSSNNIRLTLSDKLLSAASDKALIVAPCGYRVQINFPAQQILDRYWRSDFNLAVINNLVFSVPARTIQNDYGIAPPPYLLMVKTKDLDEFFANNKIPDGKASFWGAYDSSTGCYTFTSMRQYIVDLMKAGRTVDSSDSDFTLVAVSIETETNIYNETVVTSCAPYILRPAMCELDIENAKVKFIYSTQHIN